MNDCIFCKIIKGEIPSYKIYEDKDFLAFLDINPLNPGHTLVIPKEHHKNLQELPNNLVEKLFCVVKKISALIKNETKADGINILINNGEVAGQIVFHIHVHILPRFKNDGYTHWKSRASYKEGEVEKLAKKIQGGFEQ